MATVIGLASRWHFVGFLHSIENELLAGLTDLHIAVSA